MNRLYLRIFLAFWLVIALVISGVWFINSRLGAMQADERSQRERIEALRSDLTRESEAAFREDGEDGLRRWLQQLDRQFRQLNVRMITPDGDELRGKELPVELQRVAARWRASEARGPLRRFGRGYIMLQINQPPDTYLLVLQRQPESVLMRVFGPLGPWGLLALAFAVSGLVCFVLARTITRPLLELQNIGRALAGGNLDARARTPWLHRGDELGDLCCNFNRMAERLQELVLRQRQLLRDVSHELRSPLARMQVALVLAEDASAETSRLKHLARVRTECEYLEALISQILDYTRLFENQVLRQRPVDVSELLGEIASAARLEGEPRAVDVELEIEPAISIEAEPELLRRSIENVVRNALRHSPPQARVEIALKCGAQLLHIEVRDRGSGVNEADLEHIFEAFVRLSPERSESGSGGGIGLTIAREAVRRHGGRIGARNRPDGGLIVDIELPLNTSQQIAA